MRWLAAGCCALALCGLSSGCARDGGRAGGEIRSLLPVMADASFLPAAERRSFQAAKGLDWAYWIPRAAGTGPGSALAATLFETEPAFTIDLEHEVVALIEPGRFLLPLRLSAAPARVELELRYRGRAEADEPARLAFSTLTPDGEEHLLEVLDEPSELRRWQERSLSLDHLALDRQGGQKLLLVLDVDPGPPPARFEIRSPVLRTGAPARETKPEPPATRPDIVIILLDAARADHFGAYGYERDTTPTIDRLAAESVVFRNAFSECPNTVCSIANLITGAPFLELAEEYREQRLADSALTLAEVLHAAGYRTLACTASPNHSVARNSHQGYDEFLEVWKVREGEKRWDPYVLAELARETLARQPDDVPLFLFLHFIPPHEPYAPRPELDLFTDRAYAGRLRGVVRSSTAMRSGEVFLSPQDVAYYVGRYDGNLRMADDAVARVLAALRETGRWDRSLVVLTSDHGEAFYEHGRQGHNATLYREMLHVPLILKPPKGTVWKDVDPHQLALLGDLVPTLLGQVGIEPPLAAVGADLLRERPDPRRVIFHRTHQPIPLWAAQSLRFKAILDFDAQAQELYDLAADPAETVNRLAARPEVFSAFTALLREHVGLARSFQGAAAVPAELDTADEQMLRSLGYL